MQGTLLSRKTVYLVCNAHLDPVWLWEWEEGAAAAVSTFRTAADLCEEFDGFVFNHNESILYRWVEEYEPVLFERIQGLVARGKWHIMGGWYLQPDCDMPSGKSLVRQTLLGRIYFMQKFGVAPTTAINFDPFGHSRGIAQIVAKSGYDSYIFCRPGQEDCELESDQFVWVGFDGSEVLATRVPVYNTPLSKAREAIIERIKEDDGNECVVILWGVGNHGGGPSRTDLRDIQRLIEEDSDYRVVHSTPEDYFSHLNQRKNMLPRVERDLNPWAVGCYTSQVRIKQKHRLTENEYYSVEKMLTSAALQGLLAYPKDELRAALSFFPSGSGNSPKPFVTLSDDVINMTTAKVSEDDCDLIIRLFEPTGSARAAVLLLPYCGLRYEVSLAPFEIKTLRIDTENGLVTDTDLMERRHWISTDIGYGQVKTRQFGTPS